MTLSTPVLAALAAAFSSICGGFVAVATRYAIVEIDALTIAFMRHVIAGAILLAVALVTMRLRFARQDLLPIALLALLQYALYAWLFLAAFAYIPAARGALLLSSLPLVTLAFASAMGRETLTRAKLLGVLLALGGIGLAMGERVGAVAEDAWKGDVLMVIAVCIGAVYTSLAGVYLRRYRALAVTAVSIPIGLVGLFIGVSLEGNLAGLLDLSFGGWVAILFLGTIGGAGSFYFWIWALERTTPTRVAIMVMLNPLSAMGFGWLLLAEPVGTLEILGFVAVLGGILLAHRPERRPPARPASR